MAGTFQAEYGLAMGSQMVAVSKGGTNQFHGDVFEYLRNDAFDANDVLQNGSGTSDGATSKEPIWRSLWRPHQKRQDLLLRRLRRNSGDPGSPHQQHRA